MDRGKIYFRSKHSGKRTRSLVVLIALFSVFMIFFVARFIAFHIHIGFKATDLMKSNTDLQKRYNQNEKKRYQDGDIMSCFIMDSTQAKRSTIQKEFYNSKRRELYYNMTVSVQERGLTVFQNELSTQSLSNNELFKLDTDNAKMADSDRNDGVIPIHKHMETPVRAIVMPLLINKVVSKYVSPTDTVEQIYSSLRRHMSRLFSANSIWLQDHRHYHASVFHLSHHLSPTNSTDVLSDTVNIEYRILQGIFERLCPIELELDKVTVTSGGAVLALWTIKTTESIDNTEIALVRNLLRESFAYAPIQQFSKSIIIHTTLARILRPIVDGTDTLSAVEAACASMMRDLCGLKVSINAYWYVIEKDLLALGLDGEYDIHELPLACL